MPELFVTPMPSMIKTWDAELIVKALAPELNTMALTSVTAERETAVLVDVAKVAVSEGPLGIVAGVQLPASFQSPLAGLVFQLASAGKALFGAVTRSSRTAAVRRKLLPLDAWRVSNFIVERSP
jgi:hypothetical protein